MSLHDIIRERAARHDADILGQILTVSSAMAAIGVESLCPICCAPIVLAGKVTHRKTCGAATCARVWRCRVNAATHRRRYAERKGQP